MTAYEKTKAWRERHPDLRAYRAEESRKWRAAHPEKSAEIKKRFRARHRDRILKEDAAYKREWRKNNPESQRVRMARFTAKKKATQELVAGRPRPTVCELCNELNLRVVFDHCHLSGKFRGWLCDRCNKTLGHVKDSPELLRKLADYLEAHK